MSCTMARRAEWVELAPLGVGWGERTCCGPRGGVGREEERCVVAPLPTVLWRQTFTFPPPWEALLPSQRGPELPSAPVEVDSDIKDECVERPRDKARAVAIPVDALRELLDSRDKLGACRTGRGRGSCILARGNGLVPSGGISAAGLGGELGPGVAAPGADGGVEVTTV